MPPANQTRYGLTHVVQAILDTDPHFLTVDIDIFACGETLGHLLRYVRGINEPFCFNVEIVGNTVFFVGSGGDPTRLLEDREAPRKAFGDTYTRWENGLEQSMEHRRMVQYDIGNLRYVVRTACDGYIGDTPAGVVPKKSSVTKEPSTTHAASQGKRDDAPKDRIPADVLAAVTKHLESLGFTVDNSPPSDMPPEMANAFPGLIVEKRGNLVPQHALFDILTWSEESSEETMMSDVFSQLWLKQVTKMVIAHHDGHNIFDNVRLHDVQKDLVEWEKINAETIRRFATLLYTIMEVAKRDEGAMLEVYSAGEGSLEIRHQYGDGVPCLPEALHEEWAGESEALHIDLDEYKEYSSHEHGMADLKNGPDGKGKGLHCKAG